MPQSLLISKNTAVKLLNCSYSTFNSISHEFEFVKIGNKHKVVYKSIIDFINRSKNKSVLPSEVIKPQIVSFAEAYSSPKSPKKFKIAL